MNKLIYSSSPYLQQHSKNPVNWYEWGEEALSLAKELNKPLIISIGYAACHWCHVMEHESFSDKEVAAAMNENFICIKVDREERPDIDQIYMEAVHLISGQGGWPLNAFALPDGKPFYAGTYFKKQKWMNIIQQIADIYKNDANKVTSYANELTEGINNNPLKLNLDKATENFLPEDYLKIADQWYKQFDHRYGGFNRAPKFPLPSSWEFLLQYYYITNSDEALKSVEITLDAIAKGGIYDQIGGGFARYSVDAKWIVPHFEKMLYDNAQLVSLYSHAYQITGKERYKEIIDQTLDFIKRELSDDCGGCYSSLNADSEGVEGKFYVWTYDDFVDAISEEHLQLIMDYYQITKDGNWESGWNILLPESSMEEFANKNNINYSKFKSIMEVAERKLFEYRSNRERPSTDTKILTSWNALMITGYVDAYKATSNDEYRKKAITVGSFIEEKMIADNGLIFRNYMNGKASISGFHDDYAILAEACINLYSVTFDKKWLDLSRKLVEYCIENFLDNTSGMFYYTSRLSEDLVARKFELSDNVIPASNSVMATVLYKLGHLYNEDKYKKMALQMVSYMIDNVMKSGNWYSNWASLLGLISNALTEVAIVGKSSSSVAHSLQKNYLPLSVFLGGDTENLPLLLGKKKDDSTFIYVCHNNTCQLPVKDPSEALNHINLHKSPTR